MSVLKSLEEHNRQILDYYAEQEELRRKGRANGIACPECGKELVDNIEITLMSNPPQKQIWCPNCNYKGTRYC